MIRTIDTLVQKESLYFLQVNGGNASPVGIDWQSLFGERVANLVSAILILIVGWLIALIAANLVKGLLKRTDIDNRIAGWLSGSEEGGQSFAVEEWISGLVFWLILLFTIVAFLNALQLEAVTQPLNSLLDEITSFLPQIGAAAILLLIAWVVASLVKLIVLRALRVANVDRRLGEQVGAREGEEEQTTVSETIANTLYWFIFLLFLPSILSTLQLEGTLEPVQELVNRILAILPNIFAAIIIAIIGWLLAQIVRRIVTNLLFSAGTDRLGERFGVTGEGAQSLSGIIGTVVFVLILIPVAIAALEALQIEAISDPAISMLEQVLDALPKIFTAAIILILAYVFGQYISDLVTELLTSVGFNNLFRWLGIPAPAAATTEPLVAGETTVTPPPAPQTPGTRTPSEIAGIVTLVGIMLVATLAAVDILEIEQLTDLVDGIILIAGRILAGLVVFAVGLYLAKFVFDHVVSTSVRQSRLLAQAARISIIIFVSAMALQLIGIAPSLVNLAFGLLLGAIAVAIAIAFGLGSREVAGEQVREWLNSFKSRNL